jgi:hypothetical protein
LNDPDVYGTNVELGIWTPVPWYYHYFQAADRANCSPWELIDDYTPREFWLLAAGIVAGAESDHAAFVRDHAQQSQGSVQPQGSRLGGIVRRVVRR